MYNTDGIFYCIQNSGFNTIAAIVLKILWYMEHLHGDDKIEPLIAVPLRFHINCSDMHNNIQ